MNKIAVFSMDIEDWYHLDYFAGKNIDPSQTMLDGLQVYREILSQYKIPSSYFVLGELIDQLAGSLRELSEEGADIGVHGWSHLRPLLMEQSALAEDLGRAKTLLENTIQKPVAGYRAPCFSLDRDRLEVVRQAGFVYDSSRILFKEHPLYGTLDMGGFSELMPNIFQEGDFFEFQISTLSLAGFNIPVSGGGYIRMLPWFLMDSLIKKYLRQSGIYVLYIHPFELSQNPQPVLPEHISAATRMRFALGRHSVKAKLHSLIQLLREEGYETITFAELRRRLMCDGRVGI